jgi:hypothetical protein
VRDKLVGLLQRVGWSFERGAGEGVPAKVAVIWLPNAVGWLNRNAVTPYSTAHGNRPNPRYR